MYTTMQSTYVLFRAAAKAGNLSRLKEMWRDVNNLPPIDFDHIMIYAAFEAARQNRLKILKQLNYWNPILLASRACIAIAAMQNGNIKMLDYLLKCRVDFKNQYVMKTAMEKYRPELLDWLETRQLMPQEIRWEWNYKIDCQMDLLEWLWRHKILEICQKAFFTSVVINFTIDGLEWLKNNTNFIELTPGETNLYRIVGHCFEHGEIEKLEWLRKHFNFDEIIKFSQYWTVLAKNGHAHIMEWIKNNYGENLSLSLQLQGEISIIAAQHGKLGVLQWLHNNHFLPADAQDPCCHYSRLSGCYDTIVWCEQVFGKYSWSGAVLHCTSKLQPERRMRLQEYVYSKTDSWKTFMHAHMHNEWTTISKRRLLVLLLCTRRNKQRCPPPELWEQLVAPLIPLPFVTDV